MIFVEICFCFWFGNMTTTINNNDEQWTTKNIGSNRTETNSLLDILLSAKCQIFDFYKQTFALRNLRGSGMLVYLVCLHVPIESQRLANSSFVWTMLIWFFFVLLHSCQECLDPLHAPSHTEWTRNWMKQKEKKKRSKIKYRCYDSLFIFYPLFILLYSICNLYVHCILKILNWLHIHFCFASIYLFFFVLSFDFL